MGVVKCFELAVMIYKAPLELLSLNQALRSKESKVQAYWRKIHALNSGKQSEMQNIM
tara:strand:- start:460 stop:630 length:171 start_codon:yes stop_codon:yes gene_type:complete